MLNSQSIGNKIVTARKKANLSQAELARQVSISSQAVGKWERGESMPDITMLNRIAEILGVDLNYFSENFQSAGDEAGIVETIEKPSVESPALGKKPGWDMSQGNWVDADFSGLKNLKEKFGSSNMKNCRFAGSEMSGLVLKSNNVDSCDFSGSNISGSQFQNSNLGKNIFKDCALNGTEFSKCNIDACDFSNADFTGAVLKANNFHKNTLANAVWNHTSFLEMAIDDIVFDGKFEDCSFENCAFYRVTFQDSTLINTFFKNNRNLKRVKFINCKADRMTYEFLKSGKADLTGITLIQ